MIFSPLFKSSTHSVPSPDGQFVATLLLSKIIIRSVQTLRTVHEITPPTSSELAGPILAFTWSPSSSKVLIATASYIHVLGVTDPRFRAVIRVPGPSATRPSFVRFGPDDGTVYAFSSLGIKLSIFNLATTKVVEINNPKFYQPVSASRCLSFRPGSSHLAVLTRTAGRDVISLHAPPAWDAQRSWYPDTVDCQGLVWSSDGRWLIVWESASQGHKLLFYTPDGHLFRTWTGPNVTLPELDLKHAELGAGVKRCQLSPDARRVAVCDHTWFIYILEVPAALETMRFHHPATAIIPKDTLQIWKEQLNTPQSPSSRVVHAFGRVTQPISPPGPSSNSIAMISETSLGGSSCTFDASSSLLASRIEDSPTAIWIWDLSAMELRAVLIFSSDIASFRWHPSIPELLSITCQGRDYDGVVFTWDPLSNGPRPMDYASFFPDEKVAPKWQAVWLNSDTPPATVYVDDSNRYLLASLAESGDPPPHWKEVQLSPSDGNTLSIDNVLQSNEDWNGSLADMEDDTQSGPDDTFSFKKL